MYDIFTYIYHKNQLNVVKYTIHGWYGIFTPPKTNMTMENHHFEEQVDLQMIGFPLSC